MTYLSDVSSGLALLPGAAGSMGSSIDHALWFHRPFRIDDWALMDLVPVTVHGGRGTYRGSIFDPVGTLTVSLAQEMLFRTHRA